ncbi:MAG: AI-2E family transporter [Beijerinckiaceae bacterium]|nr:AI-2E family transporter [Beijerinckiaceae bacterium]MDO9441036.1 AI-2E family transporter [Beijerinckiaceae bacterium]
MANLTPSGHIRPTVRFKGRRRDDMLTALVLVAFVIAALWVGRQIFVPIAFAVLLSFVLAPAVLMLRRWRLNRVIAVLLVVVVTFSCIFGLGAVLVRQVSDLTAELPRYQVTINQKITSMREAASGSTFIERASDALRGIGEQIQRSSEKAAAKVERGDERPAPTVESPPATPAVQPIPVEVHQPSPTPIQTLQSIASTVLEPLATTGIVMIFVVFILMQREDLRDRLIRLAGASDLHRTTAAIDDAASRLSRYFLALTALNAGFGVVIGIGLSIIGVPSPILWGIVAMVMRFVPYIGAFVAGFFPVALAAAVDPGWSMALWTLALFVVLEPLVGHVFEPLLYGHSTGLSPIAVVISATFWTWLWGPIGLVLATPLTVCLVVMGRHVERLQFLDVILSDAPPLTPTESFYQRMLAGHPSEAADEAEEYLRTKPLVAYYEEIAMPGLLMAQADVRRGLLEESQQVQIRTTVREIVEDLDDNPLDPATDEAEPVDIADRPVTLDKAPATREPIVRLEPSDINEAFSSEAPILCISGRSPLDEAASSILAQLLAKHGLAARIVGPESLSPGQITHLPTEGVAMVCLSYLDADLSASHVRYAVRRIRRRFPKARLLACFWMPQADAAREGELCTIAGGDACATTLSRAIEACVEAAQKKETRDVAPHDAVA